jgi:hypothetical protein
MSPPLVGAFHHEDNTHHHEDHRSDQGEFRHLTRLSLAFGRPCAFRETNPGKAFRPRGFVFSTSSIMRTYDKLIATIRARRSESLLLRARFGRTTTHLR